MHCMKSISALSLLIWYFKKDSQINSKKGFSDSMKWVDLETEKCAVDANYNKGCKRQVIFLIDRQLH